MKEKLFDKIIKILKSKEKYVSNDGEILKAKVYADVMTMNKDLVKLLISSDAIKENFFVDIDGTLVFDKQKFAWIIDSKEFLPDSYTAYTNKIGLTNNGGFISNKSDVVLDFPYKDCVLEGGQDKDDQKRKEIFYNETLASSEIRRMLDPKVFTKAKRYTNDGVEENISFNEDDNLIIKGNNLIALTSILKRYEGKVKLINIDPPYNTGNDSFKYNDNFNHSTWLSFMKNRLEVSRKLLSEEGYIVVQTDDSEQAYLKVLMDEVFGENNYVNTVSVLLKNIAGASGGGEDKRLKKNIEYLTIYAKNYELASQLNNVFDYKRIDNLLDEYRAQGKSWKYNNVLLDEGDKVYIGSTIDGSGEEIKIYKHTNYKLPSISSLIKKENSSEYEVYKKYYDKIYRGTMPQSSIRPRVMKKYKEITDDSAGLVSIEYIPRSGKNKGKQYTQFYSGDKFNLFAWLDDVVTVIDGEIFKKEQLGTFWNFVGETKNVNKEGKVSFENGKKPERLLGKILELFTTENDLVLDYFSGSGSTLATSHKMNRKYIGIEQMDYIDEITVERLNNVIIGDSSGISKDINWQGGGSFVYCELMENGIDLIREIENTDENTIKNVKAKIYKDERIIPYITTEELEKVDGDFEELNFEDKKKALIKLVDKNKLYVNYSDIDNADFDISEEDKKFTESFYEVD